VIKVLVNSSDLVEGLNTFYYYASDINDNNEATKNFTFFSDTKPPDVYVFFSVVNDGSDEYKSVVSINVSTDGTAVCNDNFNGKSNLGNVGNNLWQSVYVVEDGSYPYQVNCTDTAGNSFVKIIMVNVARDLYITVLNPNVTTSQQPVILELSTGTAAACKFRPNEVVSYSDFSNTRTTSHTQSLGNLVSGSYTYQVACVDVLNKVHKKNVIFTVDTVPPFTVVEIRDSVYNINQSFTNVTDWRSQYFFKPVVVFRCVEPDIDNNSIEFGCDKTVYCLGNGCDPSETSPLQTLDSSQSICYKSVDNGGNSELKRCGLINVDSAGPSIKIVSPLNSSLVNDNVVDVSGTFSNNFGSFSLIRVQSSDYDVDAEISGNSFVARNVPLVDGENIVVAKVYSSVLSSQDSVIVYSDTDGPNIVLDYPIPDVAKSSFNVYGRTFRSRFSTDLEGQDVVKSFVNDISQSQDESGPYDDVKTYALSSPVSSGNNLLLSGAADVVSGNFVQSASNYDSARKGLAVPKRYEVANAFVSGTDTAVQVTPDISETISSVIVSKYAKQMGRFGLSVSIPGQGKNLVKLVPYDLAGNRGRSEWKYVFYDDVSPLIEIDDLSPHDGDVVGTLSPIKAKVVDNFAVNSSSISFDVDGSAKTVVSSCVGKSCSLSYQLTSSEDNHLFNLDITASDSVGNLGSYSWTFTYDKDAPTLISVIKKYINTSSPTFDLIFDRSVDSVSVEVDGNSRPASKVSDKNFTILLSGLSEAKHSLKVTASSGVKNGVANRDFIVDLTPPTISMISSNVTSALNPHIVGNYFDSVGIDSVHVNGAFADLKESNFNSGTFDGVIKITNGSNVNVVAVDKAGNRASYQFAMFYSKEPSFKITSVSNSLWEKENIYRTSKKSVVVSGTYNLGDVDYIVESRFNDIALLSNGNFSVEVFLDTKPGKEIMNDVKIIGYDYSGNPSEISLKIISDRKPPETPEFVYE
jgi:hypothetical protein